MYNLNKIIIKYNINTVILHKCIEYKNEYNYTINTSSATNNKIKLCVISITYLRRILMYIFKWLNMCTWLIDHKHYLLQLKRYYDFGVCIKSALWRRFVFTFHLRYFYYFKIIYVYYHYLYLLYEYITSYVYQYGDKDICPESI